LSSETALAYQWAATTMQADSALVAAAVGGVYREFAPIDTVPPYALVAQQVGGDVNTVNAIRIKTDILLRIQAIGPSGSGGNYGALVTIADRIDALFKNVRNVGVSGGLVLACYREQPLAYGEEVNGQPWSYLGGLYHIELYSF
jgi:hypothetical protein